MKLQTRGPGAGAYVQNTAYVGFFRGRRCPKFSVDKQQVNRYNIVCTCESAGIGRQARLRGVWQQSCEFKSHLSHQKNRDLKF